RDRGAWARNCEARSPRHASSLRRPSSPSYPQMVMEQYAHKRPSPSGQLVHLGGELDVELGHAAGIVGGQRHFDVLVDIEPLGMVIHLFSNQGRPRHEAEGLVEILENELPCDGVPARNLAPAAELAE